MKKLFILCIAVVGFGVSSFGQGTSTTSATIIEPVTIGIGSELKFGLISNGVGGTVTVTPVGGRETTGPKLVIGGIVSASSFTITAPTDTQITYAIAPSILTNGTESDDMAVTFSGDLAKPYTMLAGTATLLVGGTLTAAAAQPAGSYTGTCTVTVAYQ